jgi:uncharacterized glyoxalase superfamily protein PhnB
MQTNRSIPASTVIPVLRYPDVLQAVAWLCRTFDFAERLRIGSHRVQLHVGDGAVVVTEDGPPDGTPSTTHSILVRVADVDAHHERAHAAGAAILNSPVTHPYGERQYSVTDIGGHVWTFSQSVDDVDPAAWGGELIAP